MGHPLINIDPDYPEQLLKLDIKLQEHHGLIRLAISQECFIEITPDFLCPFIIMND